MPCTLSRSFPGATQTSQVTFNLSGNAEPTTGQLRIRYRLRMSATNDIQRIQINEADGFGSKFDQLNPGTTGSISFYDSTSLNPIGAATSYTVDQWLQVEIVYNLDQHTDSLWIDGNPVFTAHDYAITDRGIGRVSFGFPNAGNGTVGGFDVDDIEVLYDANPGPDVVLDADFRTRRLALPSRQAARHWANRCRLTLASTPKSSIPAAANWLCMSSARPAIPSSARPALATAGRHRGGVRHAIHRCRFHPRGIGQVRHRCLRGRWRHPQFRQPGLRQWRRHRRR